MSGPRFTKTLTISLLPLIALACGSTNGSLRSELEQNDRQQSTDLAKHRGSVATASRQLPKPNQGQGRLGQGVHRRTEWGARPANPTKLSNVGGNWEKITVHHSDEVGQLVFDGTFQQSAEAIRSIQRQHLEGNGWGDIGYHYLIDARGRIFEGRPINWQGAHAGNNSKNRRNLGICLLGNFNKEPPSAKSKTALLGLLEDLRKTHRIPRAKVLIHSEFTSTQCPGRHLADWVKAYRAKANI